MNKNIKNKKKFKEKMKNSNIEHERKNINKRRKKFGIYKKNKKDSAKISKLNEILEMPIELRGDKSKITILDFDKIFIENYLNIFKYEEELIEIIIKLGKVIINGFNLKVNEMNDEDIMIVGKIVSIEFKRN